jgi:predicted lactoylglutathione lyase
VAVPAVLSLVTLGVANVRASTRFYQELGFPLSSSSVEGEVSFFRTAGGLLAVWSTDELRKDAGLDATATTGRYREFSLAINVGSREAVDAALATAVSAGAQITRAAEATDWGGYNGYFADPDGHLWEIAHNPFWPLSADGRPELPE